MAQKSKKKLHVIPEAFLSPKFVPGFERSLVTIIVLYATDELDINMNEAWENMRI